MAKLKLTDKLIIEAANHIAFGVSAVDTYTVLGISKASWFGWLKSGKVAVLNNWPKKNAIYRKFYEAITKAKLTGKITRLQRINKAAEKDWRADAWMLERLYPDEYAKRALEITTPKNKPLEVTVRKEMCEMSDEELQEIAQGDRSSKKKSQKGKGNDA